jgi:hypothetical protein
MLGLGVAQQTLSAAYAFRRRGAGVELTNAPKDEDRC